MATVSETRVAIIGGGVVGAALALALARRDVPSVLLEADDALAYGASGTNSGVLHTGFDSEPGALETRLIRRSAELRPPVLAALGVPVLACGAELRARREEERATVAALAERAAGNGVRVRLRAEDAVLEVPGESVCDPVAYALALAAAALGLGAEVRTGAQVTRIEAPADGLELVLAGGDVLRCAVAVNCAGLHADAVARLAGDDSFAIYPRKGEFLVFDLPPGERLERILLPVPTQRTKGVLVFPTLDGRVVAGPTAVDGTDKADWSVRLEADAEILPSAVAQLPALAGLTPVARYAGLRPAGRDVNYLIGPSDACPRLINVAAIRSTGLSASLGIAEHVTDVLAGQGIDLAPERPLAAGVAPAAAGDGPWWQRTARRYGLIG